jgi:hypothetical protein
MLCYTLEGCNVDPAVGLLVVICLCVLGALLLNRDSMGGLFRRAVEALLNILVRLVEKRTGTKDNGEKE